MEFPSTLPSVVLVSKRSAFERYQDLLSPNPASDDSHLKKGHEINYKTIHQVQQILVERGLSFKTFTLEDLLKHPPPLFRPGLTPCPTSPLANQLDLVICVGGDGTLLNVSHFVGGATRLLGVNSNPKTSIGFLCVASAENFGSILDSIVSGKRTPRKVHRIQIQSQSPLIPPFPLALNDILFSHAHPAATSRYLMNWDHHPQRCISSGVWISAPAGSTGAISSYQLGTANLEDRVVRFSTREPYSSHLLPFPESCKKGVKEVLNNETFLTLKSEMREGLLSIDGERSSVPIQYGQEILLKLPVQANLNLF
jgi:NAD+ kinase